MLNVLDDLADGDVEDTRLAGIERFAPRRIPNGDIRHLLALANQLSDAGIERRLVDRGVRQRRLKTFFETRVLDPKAVDVDVIDAAVALLGIDANDVQERAPLAAAGFVLPYLSGLCSRAREDLGS